VLLLLNAAFVVLVPRSSCVSNGHLSVSHFSFLSFSLARTNKVLEEAMKSLTHHN
jgi:hypothetical protein